MKEIDNLEELKALELEIMKKIHLFCEENKIEYFLSYGTLIGAVRHKGFIPWDDDIDIFMTRPEYEKFLSIFPDKAGSLGLELVNHKTKTHYGRNLSKVIDKHTVLYEPQYKTDDPIGVFVDIWPVDGLPEHKLIRWFHVKYAILLKKMILASSMKYDPSYSFGKRMSIRIASLFRPERLVMKMDRLAKKYPFETSTYVKCYPAQHVIYSRADFDKRMLLPFEGCEFYAPAAYDKILRAEYGDYMQLPPKEKQVPHHVIHTFYKEKGDE